MAVNAFAAHSNATAMVRPDALRSTRSGSSAPARLHRTLMRPLVLIGSLLLAVPAPAQEAAKPRPQRPPPLAIGAAFAPDGTLWTVGLDARRRLTVHTSPDQGRSWSAPRELDVGADAVMADGENRPKIAFGPRGWVVVSYTKPLAKPYTGDIRLLRSSDGGQTFAPPVTVHHDRSLITHRFESIAFDEQGVLHTVWIDKRDQEAAKAGGQPYRGAGVYRNESPDGGLTFGPDIKLADHSCECCRIALSPVPARTGSTGERSMQGAPKASMAAMWRHVFEPNERDHAFAQWTAACADPSPTARGGSGSGESGSASIERATFDRWALDACPHHGPGLSPAADGGWHAVWFGVRSGSGAVRYGRLDAQGRPLAGTAVRALPDAQAEHADVWAHGLRVVIVWRSFDGKRFRLRAWESQDGGRRFALRELAQTTEPNDQPRLVAHEGRAWVVWRDAQRVQVETIHGP